MMNESFLAVLKTNKKKANFFSKDKGVKRTKFVCPLRPLSKKNEPKPRPKLSSTKILTVLVRSSWKKDRRTVFFMILFVLLTPLCKKDREKSRKRKKILNSLLVRVVRLAFRLPKVLTSTWYIAIWHFRMCCDWLANGKILEICGKYGWRSGVEVKKKTRYKNNIIMRWINWGRKKTGAKRTGTSQNGYNDKADIG